MIYLLSLVIDIGFAIWAGIGKPWYWYMINFILLFGASSIINTSYIQGLTRGYSCIFLRGAKGIKEAFGLNILTIVFLTIAYAVSYFVFRNHIRIILFFIACFALSTIVAFTDNQFRIAIEKTKSFDEIAKRNREDSAS